MAQLKVAVIDDATMIRDLIKKFIRQNFPDSKVIEADNGINATTMLKRQPVDIILCDWEMPKMDGEELLRWVRTQEHIKDKPFIMVTSRGDKEFVQKAIEAKVSDYLVKPFNNKQFLEKIYKACRRHGVKLPPPNTATAITSGGGGDSLNILTGNQPVKVQKTARSKTAPAKGVALLRTANGEIRCALKQLDLKSMLGVFKYDGFMPGLLEQVSLDLEFKSGEETQVVRINGFIQMLKSRDERADCELCFVKVFFMDEDPQKRALISEYVGQF